VPKQQLPLTKRRKTVFQAGFVMTAAEDAARQQAEADEAELFADVMTADEAAAEAERLREAEVYRVIDDYLEEQ